MLRIRNFLPDPDPYLEVLVLDPGHDLKLDGNINKNHQKKDQLRNLDYNKKLNT
jgi:hypothetical protein